MSYGTVSASPGTITDLRLTPVVTTTTGDALDTYEAEHRGCYADEEIELTYLPKSLAYRYSYTNCLFESTYEKVFNACSCEIGRHSRQVYDLMSHPDTITKPTRKSTCVGQSLKCANDVFEHISANTEVEI